MALGCTCLLHNVRLVVKDLSLTRTIRLEHVSALLGSLPRLLELLDVHALSLLHLLIDLLLRLGLSDDV